MAGVSSLLKSAQATQKKIAAQQDSLVAFDWENSAQTYEDFITYSKYLEDRSSKASDISDQLTYQTKIRSARRSYVSNEVQRQQIAIMEGRATTQDKMNAVRDLYYQAVDNGDFNLAQNLYSQYDGLSVKLQNEQDAAMNQYERTLKSGQAAADKAVKKLINDLTKGIDDVTLPTGEKVTPLAQISHDLENTGGSTATWSAAQDTLAAIRSVIIDQYNNATNQDQIDALEEKYGAGLQDIDKELTFKIGGSTLTAQDVVNAVANEAMNNPVYSLKAVRNEATGVNEFKLQKNNIDSLDYARQIDEQGNEYYAPVSVRTDQEKLMFGTSDQGRGLSTQITDEGFVIGGNEASKDQKQFGSIAAGEGKANRDSSQTIENRLKNLGIIAKQNGTTLSIKLPGESVERQATIQPDGSIRYFSDDGELVEFGLVDRNLGTDLSPQVFKAGEQRLVSPDESSDFGKASAFGGSLSRTSAQGQRYINSITGQSRVNSLVNGPIRVGNDFTGFGGALGGGGLQGTSQLLQGAAFTQRAVQAEQQKQAMLQAQADAAARLQASRTFDLNQTPVQQLANNGVLKRQLSVAAPVAQPRLYVTNAPTQQITSVGVAHPGTISSVGVASPQPRVRVY